MILCHYFIKDLVFVLDWNDCSGDTAGFFSGSDDVLDLDEYLPTFLSLVDGFCDKKQKRYTTQNRISHIPYNI